MTIIIVSSGGGGHFFPAFSLAQNLSKRNFRVILATDKTAAEDELSASGIIAEKISACKICFDSPAAFIQALSKVIKSFFESLAMLKRIKPAVLVSFGGYASLPMVVAAGFKRVPVVIHEQNVIAGRANRVSSWFAKKIALSFTETKKYFAYRKTVLTGCPIRPELFAARKEDAFRELNLEPGKFTILVMGGGQGSHRINEAFAEIVSGMDGSKLQVIHVSGYKDFDSLKNAYSKMPVKACCVAFLKKMGYAYSIADLVISRAGASSLAEITGFGIPAVLIPYPFAYNHQMANALVFKELGCAIIIKDQDLSAAKLRATVLGLINEPATLLAMKDNFNKIIIPDAVNNLAELAVSLDKNV